MNENEEKLEIPSTLSDSLPKTIEVSEPKLENIPEKVQQVFALMACGFSASSVAKLAKCTPSNIRHLTEKYDPEKKFTLSVEERRKFLAQLWEARAGEALLHITPSKLKSASVAELVSLAARATKALPQLQAQEPQRQDPYKILESLRLTA